MDRTLGVPINWERRGRAFRSLTLTTILAIVGLVTLGAVVRVTDSGLGCPDWPLCHGRIIPPLDTATLIEYSHRLVASLVGVLILAVAIFAWRSYRGERWLLFPAIAALLILIVQVILGGITVLSELPPEIVLAHLATAEALVACMVLVYLVARRGPPEIRIQRHPTGRKDFFPILALISALAVYGLLMIGSYVSVSGAGSACGQSWPLCLGRLIPEGYSPLMHFFHRVIALLVGSLIALVVALAWRGRQLRPELLHIAVIAGGLFLIQAFIGAANVWLGFPLATKVLHLTVATGTWVAIAALAVLAYIPSRSGIGSHVPD